MILIISFDRFGMFRKNISKEIANLLKEDEDEELEFITLPINKEAADSLRAYIKYKRPEMIICLGQGNFSKDIRLEVRAYDGLNKRLDSELARYLSLVSNIKLTDKIGDSICNDVYYAGLDLEESTCFFHIGIFANKESIYNQLKDIIKIAKGGAK